MTYEQALISAILALSATVGAMAIYISKIHKKYIEFQNKSNEDLRELSMEMIESITKCAIATENFNKLHEKRFR